MSKLTREVLYLNESDRPKKVEPLKFSKWYSQDSSYSEYDAMKIFNEFSIETRNEAIKNYATYRQEFSAEEVGVTFTKCVGNNIVFTANGTPSEFTEIYYTGKIENEDVFVAYKDKSTYIYFGKLNSGRY